MKDFFSSQLFGIILGALLTGGFSFLSDWCKSLREEKIYLKRKREVLYQKMYNFSMRVEQDFRTKNKPILSKETKDVWNKIQDESIFGKHETMETFYDLYEDLYNSFDLCSDKLERHSKNNKSILKFLVHIKNELGIKD